MPDYAIIIPAYNEEAYLPATLAAAREAVAALGDEFGSGEILVVDNNSTDATAQVAAAHGADRVVFEPHNQIARARNAGAAATTAERLVFLDADTRLPAETLRAALTALAGGTVAAGGAGVAMDCEVSPTVASITRTWNRLSKAWSYAAGSFFFTRRDAFEAAGGFEEKVYAGEEIHLARRIKTWAKKRKMTFVVLDAPAVITSGRKSDWFSAADFYKQIAILFLVPWAARSKRLCAMWYRRPKPAGES